MRGSIGGGEARPDLVDFNSSRERLISNIERKEERLGFNPRRRGARAALEVSLPQNVEGSEKEPATRAISGGESMGGVGVFWGCGVGAPSDCPYYYQGWETAVKRKTLCIEAPY